MHQARTGTFQVKFIPVHSSFFRSDEVREALVDTQMQCITAMDYYKDYSLEELRYDDYLIRAFRVVPSLATKTLQSMSKFTQNCPVINFSEIGEGQSLFDKEIPLQDETCREGRRKSCPTLYRTMSQLGHISSRPTLRSLPTSDSNGRSHLVRSSSQSNVLSLNTPIDINGLVQEESPQTCLDALHSGYEPDHALATKPTKINSCDKLSLGDVALNNDITSVTSCDSPTSDPSQNELIHRSGDALNLPLSLVEPSLQKDPVQIYTEPTAADKLNFTTLDVVSQPIKTSWNPSKTVSEHLPKLPSQKLEFRPSQNDLRNSSQHPGARPGTRVAAPNRDHSYNQNRSERLSREYDETEAFSGALVHWIHRMTDLQESMCDLLSQDESRETLCCHIVFELRSWQNFQFYEHMSSDLLCLAVRNRELVTKQLMNLFGQNAPRNIQLSRVVLQTLSDEFLLIGQLKLLMLKKLLETRQTNSTEIKAELCHEEPPRPPARRLSGHNYSDFDAQHKNATKSSIMERNEETDTETYDHISDMHVRALLNDENDVLVFSEPGKLFQFAVQPGKRFVEKWTEQGNGMVSVYKNSAAKQAKIVVCHWTAKRIYSVILIRPSMKAKFVVSEDDQAVKFMGLEASKHRKSMKYFQIRFKERDVMLKFRDVFQSLPFMNSVQEVADTICCLDVKFQSQRIHDEFPCMKSDETVNGTLTFQNNLQFCEKPTKPATSTTIQFCGGVGKIDCKERESCEGHDVRLCQYDGYSDVKTLAVAENQRSTQSQVLAAQNFEGCLSRKSTTLASGVNDLEALKSPNVEKGNVVNVDSTAAYNNNAANQSFGFHKKSSSACCHDDVSDDCHDNKEDKNSKENKSDDEIAYCKDNKSVHYHSNRIEYHHGSIPDVHCHRNMAAQDSGREVESGSGDDEVGCCKDDKSTNNRDNNMVHHHGNRMKYRHGSGFAHLCEEKKNVNCIDDSRGTEDGLSRIEAVVIEDGACRTEYSNVGETQEIDGGKEFVDSTEVEFKENEERCEAVKDVIEADEENRYEEIKGVIEADEKQRCDEIKGFIEADEAVQGILQSVGEERCEEGKSFLVGKQQEEAQEVTFHDSEQDAEIQAIETEQKRFTNLSEACENEVDKIIGNNSVEELSDWSELKLQTEVNQNFGSHKNIIATATECVKKSEIRKFKERIRESELQPSNNSEIKNGDTVLKISEQDDLVRKSRHVGQGDLWIISEDVEQGDLCRKSEDVEQGDLCRKSEDDEQGDLCRKSEDDEQGDLCRKSEDVKQSDLCRKFEDDKQGDLCRKPEDDEQGDLCRKPEDVKQGDLCKISEDVEQGDLCRKSEDDKQGDICEKSEDVKHGDLCKISEDVEQGHLCKKSEDVKQGNLCRRPEDVKQGDLCRISEGGKQIDLCRKSEDVKHGDICEKSEDVKQGDFCEKSEDVEHDDICDKSEDVEQGDICRKLEIYDYTDGRSDNIKQNYLNGKVEGIEQCSCNGNVKHSSGQDTLAITDDLEDDQLGKKL